MNTPVLTKLETPETFFTTQRYVRALLADIERLEGMLAKAAIEITELQQRLESRVEPEAEIARLTRERDEWAAVAAQRNRDRLAAADEPRALLPSATSGVCNHCGVSFAGLPENRHFEPSGRPIYIRRDEAEFIDDACLKDGAPQWHNLQDQVRDKFGMTPASRPSEPTGYVCPKHGPQSTFGCGECERVADTRPAQNRR
jgi:hypothetical protein